MRITPDAQDKLKEFLMDIDDGFVRVAALTVGGG